MLLLNPMPATASSKVNDLQDIDVLSGLWRIDDIRTGIKNIFDYSLYEKHKDSGISFTKMKNIKINQPSAKNMFKSYSWIDLGRDETFSTIDATFDMTSGDKIAVRSTSFTGTWTAQDGVLSLTFVDSPNEEIVTNATEKLKSRTYEFSYKYENSKLVLFPKFDKQAAYELLSQYLENPSQLYDKRQIIYSILENSESLITAYSLKELQDKITQMRDNPSLTTKNTRFIKDLLKQWFEGKSGLPVEKLADAPAGKTPLMRAWYYEKEDVETFMNLINPIMPLETKELILEPKHDKRKETYAQLDIRKDGSVSIRTFFINDKNDSETYMTEYDGVWELNFNTVSMKFGKQKNIDSGKTTGHSADYFFSFKAKTYANKLIISKNMPSAGGYIQIKEYIKAARTKQQYFPFNAIPEMISDKYSSLTAYDIYRLRECIQTINESMPEKKTDEVAKACDEMDAIVDKWYNAFLQQNK
jgi:hypothetical protein